MAASLLTHVLAQQLARDGIDDTYMASVPLHTNRTANPAWWRAVVRGIYFDAAIQIDGPLAVLVIAEGLQRQRLKLGFLFGEHGGDLTFGGAVNARIGPAFLPAVQVSLSFAEAFEAQSAQRSLLRVSDTGLDFSLSIGMADAARQRDGAIVGQQIAVERIQRGIVDVGLQDAVTEVVQDHDARGTAEAAECLLMQFSPDATTRFESEQPNRLAAVSEGQDEEACAPVLARVRIAHHRTVAVIDLRFLAWSRFDDGAGLPRRGAVQLANKSFDALIIGGEAVIIDQFLPDRLRVAAERDLGLDPLAPRVACACRWLPPGMRRLRAQVGVTSMAGFEPAASDSGVTSMAGSVSGAGLCPHAPGSRTPIPALLR